MINVITTGKFYPFHKGHAYMLDFAEGLADHLFVIVSGNAQDAISLDSRVEAVESHFTNKSYLTGKDITIIKHIDNIGSGEKDAEGTLLDENLLDQWADYFKQYVKEGCNNFFVSSDLYGKVMAEKLGISWAPVDPDREFYSISGTQIRRDINKHFNSVAPSMQPYLNKKIAIIGAESVGKSTLVKELEAHFSTITTTKAVPEYGRTLSTNKTKLTEEDFELIMYGQLAGISSARHNRLIISDTEAYTTYLFSKMYLAKEANSVKQFAENHQWYDHYILLDDNTPWVQDGTRVVYSQKARKQFTNDLLEFLHNTKQSYTYITEADFGKRKQIAITQINQTLQDF